MKIGGRPGRGQAILGRGLPVFRRGRRFTYQVLVRHCNSQPQRIIQGAKRNLAIHDAHRARNVNRAIGKHWENKRKKHTAHPRVATRRRQETRQSEFHLTRHDT